MSDTRRTFLARISAACAALTVAPAAPAVATATAQLVPRRRLTDRQEASLRKFLRDNGDTYRTLEYVQSECAMLAQQAAAVALPQ